GGGGGTAFGQALQGFAGDARHAPVVQDLRALVLVEVDGVLVPVQHHPFEAPAALFHGQLGQVAQHGCAQALLAVRRVYVQVFQVDAAPVQEAGVVVEPHDVGDRRVRLVFRGDDQAVGAGFVGKKAVAQRFGSGAEDMLQFLEGGQVAHQSQDGGDVGGAGGAKRIPFDKFAHAFAVVWRYA